MDALTHAVEAIIGKDWSPIADALATKAVELIFANLVQATKKGDDLEARGSMLIASTLAGIAFTHSMVGCVHGMATRPAHCTTCRTGRQRILLPHGLEYNLRSSRSGSNSRNWRPSWARTSPDFPWRKRRSNQLRPSGS